MPCITAAEIKEYIACFVEKEERQALGDISIPKMPAESSIQPLHAWYESVRDVLQEALYDLLGDPTKPTDGPFGFLGGVQNEALRLILYFELDIPRFEKWAAQFQKPLMNTMRAMHGTEEAAQAYRKLASLILYHDYKLGIAKTYQKFRDPSYTQPIVEPKIEDICDSESAHRYVADLMIIGKKLSVIKPELLVQNFLVVCFIAELSNGGYQQYLENGGAKYRKKIIDAARSLKLYGLVERLLEIDGIIESAMERKSVKFKADLSFLTRVETERIYRIEEAILLYWDQENAENQLDKVIAEWRDSPVKKVIFSLTKRKIIL